MRFVRFEVPNAQTPIYINRTSVRTVRAGSSGEIATLFFAKDHSVAVVGSAEEVVQRLED